MDLRVAKYLEIYSDDIRALFCDLRALVYDCGVSDLEERLWAKLPSYYAGDAFVRLIPFKDHINIEASALRDCKEELSGVKFTPKGMVQLRLNQPVPREVLRKAFFGTLCERR